MPRQMATMLWTFSNQFLYENCSILIHISLNFTLPIDNTWTLVQIVARAIMGDKQLSELMMGVQLFGCRGIWLYLLYGIDNCYLKNVSFFRCSAAAKHFAANIYIYINIYIWILFKRIFQFQRFISYGLETRLLWTGVIFMITKIFTMSFIVFFTLYV